MARRKCWGWLAALLAGAAVAGGGAEARAVEQASIPLPMATVGNAGNLPDTRFAFRGVAPRGSVAYAYRIGKHEITAGQYATFLNAVAADDPYGLYNVQMSVAASLGCNIVRSGVAGDFSYTVASDWARRPVNYVSVWDMARFANWLHNGQPTGAQDATTTEAGAYLGIGDSATFARQPGARFFLPTEDEWYKAAYHQQAAGQAASYINHPTNFLGVAGRDVTEATNPGRNANYFDGGLLLGAPYYRTPAGQFFLSTSPYGTFDQGGNVWEASETLTGVEPGQRWLRGGSLSTNREFMSATSRQPTNSDDEWYEIGFRVAAAIPEPSGLVLGLAAMALSAFTRRGA